MSTPEAISARRNRSGRRALLIWGAVLVLSGSGIGAGGALLFHKPPAPPVEVKPSEPDPGPPDFRPGPIVSHMSRELQLTPEQTEKVTAAYAQSLAAIKTLRADMVVKLSVEHEKLRAAMKKTLTEEQFARWDQHFEAMRTRMMPDGPPPHDFHHHGGPGDGMDGPDGRGRGPGPGMMHRRGPGGPDGPEDHDGDGPDAHQTPPGPQGGPFRDDGGRGGPRGEQGDHGLRKGGPPTGPEGPDGQPPAPTK